MMINLTKYHSVIMDAQRILLTTHENPDGDGLGCETAFYEYLSGRGKECRIINVSPFPVEYEFLDPDGRFEVYNKSSQTEWIAGVDLAIILDIGDYKRIGALWDAIKSNEVPTMNIDHHPHLNHSPFTYDLVNIKAAATGEMIYNYLKDQYQGKMPMIICDGIYTAIMTDTGSFRHNNTTV